MRSDSSTDAMAYERREHVRYEPIAPVGGLLIWHDEDGGHQAAARLADLSEGGCALLSVETPPVETLAIARLSLAGGAEAVTLRCRILSQCPQGESLLISMRFEQLAEPQLALLRSVLASGDFQPLRAETTANRRKLWRVPQWAAYLTVQRMPVMPRSKRALADLEAEKGGELSIDEFVGLVQGDPFLCLALLREAESKRSTRLGSETSTPLAAVMQLGATKFRELLLSSPETDENQPDLARCEARAVLAGRLAEAWSALRADASPDEVAMAALLSEIGELMLWHFAPEVPQAALDALARGEVKRTALAQENFCGFKFFELTLKCAEIWKLPSILTQLIRGHDSVRANLARLCRDTARHMMAGPDNPALPDDIAAAKEFVPNASLERLIEAMGRIPEEMVEDLMSKASGAMERRQQAAP